MIAKKFVRDRKGFTLVELVVSMTLTVIVLALAVSFVSLITKFSASQQNDYDSNVEYRRVISLLDEFRDAYSVSIYHLDTVENNSITITHSEESYSLTYNMSNKSLTAQISVGGTTSSKVISLSKITGISFERSGKIINVEIVFSSYPTRHYLLDFGATA